MATDTEYCSGCGATLETTWRVCPICGCETRSLRRRCHDHPPAGSDMHWLDWHRGHGCHLDDGQPRSPGA